MAKLALFFLSLFFKLPTELCYLIFLRRSRCHLPLMTIDKREIHPTWMQCILEYIGLLWREFLEVSVFHWLSWWPPCRSLCEIICPFTDHISWNVTWIYTALNISRWDVNQERLFQSGIFNKLMRIPSSPQLYMNTCCFVVALTAWFAHILQVAVSYSPFSLLQAEKREIHRGQGTASPCSNPSVPCLSTKKLTFASL